MSTPLADLILRQIVADGPMPLADYMALCLSHPEHGYYATRDPLGRGGDFVTAPEISQMFGELIGLSLAQCWLDQGAPNPVTFAELGPGRGTLMADALRATRGVAGFHDALEVWLVETSPALRAVQRETLKHARPRWANAVNELPEQPLLLVANEFFDALPIRQFQRTGAAWRERVVGMADGTLQPGLSDPWVVAHLSHRLEDTEDGTIVETCAPATSVTHQIGQTIAAHGGTALIVDYGDWRSLGDTFQALQNHQPTDPFAAPGDADLTAHVDFEALACAAQPARFTKLTPQGVFLERLGITPRAEALAGSLSGEALATLIAAHRRLTHPAEMGSLFKVLGLYPENANPPPGLEP